MKKLMREKIVLSAGEEFSSFSTRYPKSFERALKIEEILLNGNIVLEKKMELLLLCKCIRTEEQKAISRKRLSCVGENAADFPNLTPNQASIDAAVLAFDQKHKKFLETLKNETSVPVIHLSQQKDSTGLSASAGA